MKKNILNIYIYIAILVVSCIIIIITPIDNVYLSSVTFIIFSIYLMLNYFNNIKFVFKRELYIFWSLIAILVVIFTFNIINIILFVVFAIILFMQFIKKNKNRKKEFNKPLSDVPEVKLSKTTVNVDLPSTFKEDEFYEIAKELYISMQKYFVNFDYEKLKEILNEEIFLQFEKQMNYLEKNNKKAVRDNIEIIDFKINKFQDNINNLLVTVSMGVLEDKYTLNCDEDKKINCRYETYYEVVFKKSSNWTIHSLNLINSRSKKS